MSSTLLKLIAMIAMIIDHIDLGDDLYCPLIKKVIV